MEHSRAEFALTGQWAQYSAVHATRALAAGDQVT
jgi:hypothetical protein